MEVILTQNVPSLGNVGQVVKVKEGYARNYLLPRKLGYHATPQKSKRIELQEKGRKEKFEQERQESLALAEKLAKVSCTVNVEVNDLERLYGSISETDVVKALEVEGFSIDKKQVLF